MLLNYGQKSLLVAVQSAKGHICCTKPFLLKMGCGTFMQVFAVLLTGSSKYDFNKTDLEPYLNLLGAFVQNTNLQFLTISLNLIDTKAQ